MSIVTAVVAAGTWIWDNKDELSLEFARLTHGVTNVRNWRNDTDQELEVWKLDGSFQWQDHYRIAPGQTGGGDMWIPWANNATEYTRKHAVIQVGGQILACVWQQGTQIRFNTADEFVPGGQSVPGEAEAGGERTIVVRRDPQGRLGFAVAGYRR
jgi:hypothetical protein